MQYNTIVASNIYVHVCDTKGLYGIFLVFTELTLIFDQDDYSVDEGKAVDVMVTLFGNITNDVMVSVMTDDGTAGILQPFSCQF